MRARFSRTVRSGGLLIPVLAYLLVPDAATAQNARQFRVNGERIKSYIDYVAADEFLGRQSMTPAYARAAEWAAARFEEWGLAPAGDNGTYFQSVPIGRAVTWTEGVPELKVGGTAFSVHDGDFSLLSFSTTATSGTASVVFAGYGISAPDKGLDEYAGIDVRGKVVLALRGDPTAMPEPTRRGSMAPGAPAGEPLDADLTAEATDAAKARAAYDHGAAAILLYNPDEAQAGGGGRGGGRGGASFEPTRDFLAFSITDRVFHALMRKDDQETNRGISTRLSAMRTQIKYGDACSTPLDALVEMKGYDSTIVYSEENGNNIARNIIAKIEGTDRQLRNQYVIMGGHFDHLGMRDGIVRNGADDNASGSAVVMEIARVFAEGGFRPRRTIIFCLWCGEELGLIGSQYYADHPPDGVTMDGVVTYFNMDMVGLGTRIGAPGALNFPEIWEVIIRDQDPDVIAAVDPRTGGPGGSDHSAFIVQGIESLGLMTSGGVGHPNYHQPEDDPEYIEPEILRKTGQFVLQGTFNLANERNVNLLIPDRENRFNAMMLSVDHFSPDLPGSQYGYLEVAMAGRNDLVSALLDSAMAIARRPAQTQASPTGGRGGGARPPASRATFNRGIRGVGLFEGDVDLMVAASELLGFGRIDILAEDGRWFSGGRLTTQGRTALQAMEANGITLRLHSPSQQLLTSVLDAAEAPFLVTGNYTLTAPMVAAAKEKQVVFGVTFNPADVRGAVVALNGAKALFGDTGNICLCATTEDGFEEAKTALYMALVAEGWTNLEIAGDRRAGGGIAGGSLRRFSGGGGGGFGR